MSLKHDAVPANPYHGAGQQGLGTLTSEYDALVINVQDKDKQGKVQIRKEGYQSNLSDQPDEQCQWVDVADGASSGSTGMGGSTKNPSILPGAMCTVRQRGGTTGQHIQITNANPRTSKDSGQTYNKGFTDQDEASHGDSQGAQGDKTFAHSMPLKEIQNSSTTQMAMMIRESNKQRVDKKSAPMNHKETIEVVQAGGGGEKRRVYKSAMA